MKCLKGMKKSLNEFYASNETPDRSIIWVGLGFLVFAIIMLVVFIGNLDRHVLGTEILSIYLILLFFEMPMLMISTYFFQKKSSANCFRTIKYAAFCFSVVIFCITLIPVAVFLFVLDKLKFKNIYSYINLYGGATVISLFINILFGTILWNGLIKLDWLEPLPIVSLGIFTLNYFVMKFIGFIYFKFKISGYEKKAKKNKEQQELWISLANSTSADRIHYQKELYVLNFAIISFGTLVLYCFNLKYLFNGIDPKFVDHLKSSILYGFALYTAFDRLYDKWKKTFDDKREIKELKFEIETLHNGYCEISERLHHKESNTQIHYKCQQQKGINTQKESKRTPKTKNRKKQR